MADSTDKNRWLNRAVLGVGRTSQFTDWSHEAATAFLAAIGARPDWLGAIEHGTGVTNYSFVNTTTREIDGTADVNGQSGFTYRVMATDNDQPGANDFFSIQLFDSSGNSNPFYTAEREPREFFVSQTNRIVRAWHNFLVAWLAFRFLGLA